MLDCRNVLRGECLSCPPGECVEYDRPSSEALTKMCGYCGCPPVKHRRESPIVPAPFAGLANSNTQVEYIGTSYASMPQADESFNTVVIHEEPAILPISRGRPSISNAMGTYHTNSKRLPSAPSPRETRPTIASQDYELPKFSSRVEEALQCRSDLAGALWHRMIAECCQFYYSDPSVRSRVAYERIGIAMVSAYPAISSPGRNPWSRFSKCLSVKMRNARAHQNKETMARNEFQLLPDQNHRNENLKKECERRCYRQNFDGPSPSMQEVMNYQREIREIWNKPNKDLLVLKYLLNETYRDRSEILKSTQPGFPFMIIQDVYPCFESSEIFLHELSLTVGRDLYEQTTENMKKFVFALLDLYKMAANGELEKKTFNCWRLYEEKAHPHPRNMTKEDCVILFCDEENYSSELIAASTGVPRVLVVFEGDSLKEAVLVAEGLQIFFQESELNLASILLVVLAVFYSMEIDYPKQYCPQLGLLTKFVLPIEHTYSKMGRNSQRVEKDLNKFMTCYKNNS